MSILCFGDSWTEGNAPALRSILHENKQDIIVHQGGLGGEISNFPAKFRNSKFK